MELTEEQIYSIGFGLESNGLSHSAIDDHFLEHYGVKGMKWGQRKANFQRNRALNKTSRAKEKDRKAAEFEKTRVRLRPSDKPRTFDLNTKEGRKASREARKKDIDRARERVNSGALRADQKQAKAEYKADKIEIGTREARKILKAKRNDLYKDVSRSKEVRDGFELTVKILDGLAESAKERNRVRTESATGTRPGYATRTSTGYSWN